MSKMRVLTFVAVAMLALTGCFEVEQEYTLNPDGSGKVVHRVVQPDLMGQGDAALQQLVNEQLQESTGVDAWSDVSVSVMDTGSLEFIGTAYFSDINELELGGGGMQFNWDPATSRLSMAMEGDGDATAAPAPSSAEEVAQAKKEWMQMRPMMQGMLGSLSWKSKFNLPGNVTTSSAFKKIGPRAVELSIKGEQYFQLVDSIMTDDAALQELAATGSLNSLGPEGDAMPPMLAAKLFGSDKVEALSAPSKTAQFDYGAAVASAEANYDGMMAELPVEKPKEVLPAAKGGDFRSLEVVQVSFVTNGDLAWSQEGARLSVSGGLPGSVIGVEAGELTVATADDGQNLLPEEEWSRSVDPSLDSEDPSRVSFDVQIGLPSAKAKGFKEIAGKIYYLSSSQPDSEVEVFSGIRPDSEGKALGAAISTIEEGYSEGTQHLTIDLQIPREELSELVFMDGKGRPIAADLVSTSWNDDSISLVYSYEGTYPRDGRIIAKVRQGLQRFEIPFRLTNLDLMGRPR